MKIKTRACKALIDLGYYFLNSHCHDYFFFIIIKKFKQPLTFLSKIFLDFSQYSQEDFSKSPQNFEL